MCATVWPTRALNSTERWFDEIYFWTEGFEASTTQRARIQTVALENAFFMLENEHADRVGVTISFGTVERFLDPILDAFQKHALVTQRIVIILRGSIERLRSRYRVRAFINYLRGQQIPVGYRVSNSRITMELEAIDFLQPDFVKLLAPKSLRGDAWHDFMVEAEVAGVPQEWMIVAGLAEMRQVILAREAGVRFGQGTAVRPPYSPHPHTPSGSAIFGRTGMLFVEHHPS